MATRSSHSAAPMVSGVILQLERALYHLSIAGHGEAVSVEAVDDVARHKPDGVAVQEQDKNTIADRRSLLGDRSTNLWRTLQIWVQGFQKTGNLSTSYLLVTNAQPVGNVVDALRRPMSDATRTQAIVDALSSSSRLRQARKTSGRSESKIQQLIDDVMKTDEPVLRDILSRVELVEAYDAQAMRPDVAARLGVSPDIDSDLVLNALMGWLVELLGNAWKAGQPGIVSKAECLRYLRQSELGIVRRRLVPRPASEVAVGDTHVRNARGRPFVDHLTRVEVGDVEVLQAIEHFVRFNIERHRLAKEGEIPITEWADRGNRLRERWQYIVRQVALNHGEKTSVLQGKHILAETTYHHKESLAGQPCDELYMTSGHYHRLADDNGVWWDPAFKAE